MQTCGITLRDRRRSVCWSGMTIARLNFSHGTYDYHRKSIENVREAESRVRRPIAIALDTKGPEIRTGLLSAGVNAEIELMAGDPVTVTIDDKYQDACDASIIWVDYKSIVKVVDVGRSVFIDDGLLSFIVQEKREDSLKVLGSYWLQPVYFLTFLFTGVAAV